MNIHVVCSWCNKVVGVKKTDQIGDSKFRTTHGICDACSKIVKKEFEDNLENRYHSDAAKKVKISA